MLHISGLLTVYVLFVFVLLGLAMGSFTNCLSWRLVHGENVARGRSHCAVCGHPLSARELIPVFSWLFQKGRCNHCGEKISVRYPLTELISAVSFAGLVLRYDVTPTALKFMVLTMILLAVALVDLDSGLIPNGLLLAAIGNFIVFSLLDGLSFPITIFRGILSGLSIFVPLLLLVLIMDRVLGRESMGGGDLKLFFVIGLYFDWKINLYLLMLSCILGLLFTLVFQKARIKGDERAFPFGPAIAAAAYLSMLFAESAVRWYVGLL